MSGTWTKLTTFNSDEATDVFNNVSSAVAPVTELLTSVKSVVNSTKTFLDRQDYKAKRLISGTLALVEQALLNTLNTRAHLCVYSNLRADPDWSWKPKSGFVTESKPNPNFADGDMPVSGSGVTGWLYEILLSVYDKSNIQRPITDSKTPVGGLVFIIGASDFSEIHAAISAFKKVYPRFDSSRIDAAKKTETQPGDKKHHQSLGGYGGSRVAKLSDGLEAELAVAAAKASLSTLYSDVLPTDLSSIFVNSPGPVWVSTPAAGFFGEPAKRLTNSLETFVSENGSSSSALISLVSSLAKKIERIEETLVSIENAIQSLSAIIDALDRGSVYCGFESSGGASQFFSNAASHKDVPNFGEKGFVIGAVLLGSFPTADPLLTLGSIFGMDLSSTFSGSTEAGAALGAVSENISDVCSAVTTPSGDLLVP